MGTLVNAIAVVAGSLIGLLIRRGLPERVEGAAMKLLGLSVLIIGFNGVVTSMVTVGADGSLSSDGSLLLIASLVIGGRSTTNSPGWANGSKNGLEKRDLPRALSTVP